MTEKRPKNLPTSLYVTEAKSSRAEVEKELEIPDPPREAASASLKENTQDAESGAND